MGGNPQQTLLAFREAEAYEGPSLILAYSHCIAHGINMQMGSISRTGRCTPATGRCSATTRRCASPAKTPSSSICPDRR